MVTVRATSATKAAFIAGFKLARNTDRDGDVYIVEMDIDASHI